MVDYKTFLNTLDVKALKKFIKDYMAHVKIVMTRKKKDELIEHIMIHTELRGDKIVLKDKEFDMPVPTPKVERQPRRRQPKAKPKPEPEPERKPEPEPEPEPERKPEPEPRKPRRRLKEENIRIVKKILKDKPKKPSGVIDDSKLYELENNSHFSELLFILKEEGSNNFIIKENNINYKIIKNFNSKKELTSIDLVYKDNKNKDDNFTLKIVESIDEDKSISKEKPKSKNKIKDEIGDKEIEIIKLQNTLKKMIRGGDFDSPDFDKLNDKIKNLKEGIKDLKNLLKPDKKSTLNDIEQKKLNDELVMERLDLNKLIEERKKDRMLKREEIEELDKLDEMRREKELYDLNNNVISTIEQLLKLSSPYKRQEYAKKSFKKINDIVDKFKEVNINKKDLEFLENYLQNYGVQKQTDFYPTPEKCLDDDIINNSIMSSINILEPTAGLGSIINYIRKIKIKSDEAYKITAIEYTQDMTKFLKTFSPDVLVNPEGINNFLKYNPDNVNHDLIIINPPFSYGTDKRYYIDFLFHCLYILNRSKVPYYPEIIFISPPIVKNEPFSLNNILDEGLISQKKKLEIYNKYKVKKSDDYEIDNTFGFLFGQKIGQCSGFTGTGIKVDVYYIQGYNRSKSELKKIEFKNLF